MGIIIIYVLWRALSQQAIAAPTVPQTLTAGDGFNRNCSTIASGICEPCLTPNCQMHVIHPPLHVVFPVAIPPIVAPTPLPAPKSTVSTALPNILTRIVNPAPTYPLWDINKTWNVGDIARQPGTNALYICIQRTTPPAHTLGFDHYWIKYNAPTVAPAPPITVIPKPPIPVVTRPPSLTVINNLRYGNTRMGYCI